jgi:drug/metabolite transporter (DMT)-like permease
VIGAFLTAILWAGSAVFANRSTKLIGGSEANFWRLAIATAFLCFWAFSLGQGVSGVAFPYFLLSGLIGIGIGDVALFQSLPRLGSRLSILLVQCLSTPFAALIEYLWIGTTLNAVQILCAATILVGVGLALSPGKHLIITRRQLIVGVIASVIAALGNATGAVLSRKGYGVVAAAHDQLDGGTAAFQRLIGGLFVAGVWLLIVKQTAQVARFSSPAEKWKKIWPWVTANAIAGQTLGVSCYQWALKTAPTGVVMPIVALTPLIVIPFSRYLENERPSVRSLIGGVIAVAGVAALLYFRTK